MKNIDVLNNVLKEIGVEIDTTTKRRLLKELFPIEKLPSPHFKKTLEKRIASNMTNTRLIEKKTEEQLRSAFSRYDSAVSKWRNGGEDGRGEIVEEVVKIHRKCTLDILKLMLSCAVDSVQLTNSVRLKAVSKHTRDYTDGYLSHYNQAVGKVKSLKDRTWI